MPCLSGGFCKTLLTFPVPDMSAIHLKESKAAGWSIFSRSSHHNSSPAEAKPPKQKKPETGNHGSVRVQKQEGSSWIRRKLAKLLRDILNNGNSFRIVRKGQWSPMAAGTRKGTETVGHKSSIQLSKTIEHLQGSYKRFNDLFKVRAHLPVKKVLPKEISSSHLPSCLCAWFPRTNPKLSYYLHLVTS